MAKHGEMGKTIYSISKGAVSSGCRSLALEYASKKIRVNSIAPGIVRTPMNKNSKYLPNTKINERVIGVSSLEKIKAEIIFIATPSQYVHDLIKYKFLIKKNPGCNR